MFCSNCGLEITGNMNFCSNCGFNMNNNSTQIRNEDDLVTFAFNEVFLNSQSFGDKVYIPRKDRISKKIETNLDRFYLDYRDEVPLLIFDYSDHLRQGFVITNQKIVWKYGEKVEKKDIWEIFDVVVEKAVLARVMRLIDFNNKKSGRIFLTGIRPDLERVYTN